MGRAEDRLRYCWDRNTERRPRFILLARVNAGYSRSLDVG